MILHLQNRNHKYIFIHAMKNKGIINTRKIVGTGILTALLVVLQALSMVIPTGVNLNLSLVPITIGAILYGPLAGAFLGLACGVIILVSPNTVTFFMSISPVGTILACLLKTTIAGLLAGFFYKWIGKKNETAGVIVASIIVPLVNTAIFVLCTSLFFMDGLRDSGVTSFGQIFTVLIGFNFIFEIITNTVVSPVVYRILKIAKPTPQD